MKTIHKVHARRAAIVSLFLLTLLLMLLPTTTYGGGGKGASTALSPCDDITNMTYALSNAIAVPAGNAYLGKVNVTFDSKGNTITDIQVTISYDPDAFFAPDVDTNPTVYYDWPALATVTWDGTHPGWFFVQISNFSGTINTSKPIFGLGFRSKCIDDYTYWPVHLARSTDSPPPYFYNEVYVAGTGARSICDQNMTDGVITIPEAEAWIWAIHDFQSYIGAQNVRVPVYVESNFPADSYWVRISYPTDKLTYRSISFDAAWGSSNPDDHYVQDNHNGTVDIYYFAGRAPLPAVIWDTVFTVYFDINANQSQPQSITYHVVDFEVLLTQDHVVCLGDDPETWYPLPAWIDIPQYQATFKVKNRNIPANPPHGVLVGIPIEFQSNFPAETDAPNFPQTVNFKYSMRNVNTSCCSLFTASNDYQPQYPDIETPYGTMRWSTDYHGDGSRDGIQRFESPDRLSPMLPPLSAYTVIDSIRVNPANTSYCRQAVGFIANASGEQFRTDFFVKAKYVSNPWLYAADDVGDPHHLDTIPGYFQIGTPPCGCPPCCGCPYLYAWDGDRFSEENTIIGHGDNTALAKPRPDFYRLATNLKPQEGRYLLQIREFEREQSYFDGFDLAVVDHPQGTLLNVSHDGDLRVYRDELYPAAAIDDFGVDHVTQILDEDGAFFTSVTPGTLTLTFIIGKDFKWDIAALGEAPGGPRPKDNDDNMEKRVAGGDPNYEPGLVFTEILNGSGQWIPMGELADRATVSTEISTFNPADFVHNGKIIMRQRWESTIYVDKLSLYLPTREPWTETKLNLVSAIHSADGNVLRKVASYDNETITLIPGETIELAFAEDANVPVQAGYVREFVFSSSGYYTGYKGTASVPETYDLLQNYPNPFNPATTIYYNLVTATDVTLVVYNTLGQRVRTLVNGMQTAGRHSTVWDGTDDNGTAASSGIYLYKLTTPDYSATRKMMLIK